MEIFVFIVIVVILMSIFGKKDGSKTIVRTMTKKEEKEFWKERGGRYRENSQLFGGPNRSTSTSERSCSHSWKRVKHDGGTKLECRKCYKRDHDSWQP